MASINWVRHRTGDKTTMIYNLDQASYFRHVEAGDESAVEFEIQDEKYTVMYSMDREAYQAVLAYIREVTGHELS
jgi:hypothetical protein